MSEQPHLSNDLTDFLKICKSNDVEFLVIGGWAVAQHGYIRATKDLDVFVNANPKNAVKIVKALEEFGFGALGLKQSDFSTPGENILLGRVPNRIDILTVIDGVTFEEAWPSRVHGVINEIAVDFIGLNELLKNKTASGRQQDLLDRAKLEAINKK